MKNTQSNIVRKVCLGSGIFLLAAAAALFLSWQLVISTSEHHTESYIQTLLDLIPEPQNSVQEERKDRVMPVLAVDGTDFIGIIEIPSYSSVLPVCAEWGQIFRYPCCFNGSVYDSSIQIGGTSQKGQYDFYREISVGDALFFTDMTGNRYAYIVKNILYTKSADPDTLKSEEAALTLFIKNVYAFEYILLFCEAAD